MWQCGGEHYSDNQRFIKGYNNTSKEINERGFDLNRFLWNMKRKLSSNIKQIVCISNWLKKRQLQVNYLKIIRLIIFLAL